MARRFLYFKYLILIFALFFAFSCSSKKELGIAPDNFTESDNAHLLSIKSQLASSKDFYIELSIREKKINLCHSGTVLRSYPFKKISLEKKRFLFIQAGKHFPFNNTLFSEGNLYPQRIIERVRVVPGDESTRPTPEAPGIIPPTMEDIIAVPPVYDLDFKGSFSIRFILDGEIPGKKMKTKKLHLKWNDFLTGVGIKKGPSLRLKIEMDSKEGAAFFRSCPEKTKLLILP
ncbi:MAG: hypothetical protein GYA35_06695 [Thermoanaerobaculaceae bacterium]|nr:hypothetical protein [Thermoanaerobaculaceae bacterium]